ncbi:MAG: hypothetical protein HC853_00800 [Anaerolineae bacterium]|nr:hypothetical protein [Anaerolineae bacterium]
MTKTRVIVFDDEKNRREGWTQKLQGLKGLSKLFSFDFASPEEFAAGVAALEHRRQLTRAQSGSRPNDSSAKVFDDADVLVLDYDLFELQNKLSTTGEWVAYLVRCYSRCGIIVGVNQFVRAGKSSFDLTLRGHPESFADLNIGDADLNNEGLWMQPKGGFQGFRPWYWPLLSNATDAFEQRAAELANNLDQPILTYLDLDRVADLLPRTTVEFIGRGTGTLRDTTFRSFVENSGNGLRLKDRAIDDGFVARIAAARITAWLESLVLPSQDILVDAPHLVARYPSLIRGQRSNPSIWNAVASLALPQKSKPIAGLNSNKIEALRFRHQTWISRPTWYWNQVSESTDIDEVRDPFKSVPSTDLVFCEDISRFMPRASARDFSADVAGPFDRRFVVDQDAKMPKSDKKSLANVDYEPRVRFVL